MIIQNRLKLLDKYYNLKSQKAPLAFLNNLLNWEKISKSKVENEMVQLNIV